MDALVAGPSLSASINLPTPKELAERALNANKVLQQALTKRAEELEAEIQEAERLLNAATVDEPLEEPEDDVQIPGAKKPVGWFPVSECLNPESPFYRDATLRNTYASRVSSHSMKAKELEALAAAVKRENQRLEACRMQERNTMAEPIDVLNNVEGVNWDVVAEKVSDIAKIKYTAEQCRIKWVGDRHPQINHSDWKPSELQQLASFVEAAKKSESSRIDWVDVAKKLGTNRTPIDCMRRGVPRARHLWDADSDERLLEAVDMYGYDNWMLVARYVSPHATPGQCQGRYTNSLDPTVKRGAWTTEEDERLRKAVAAFGSSWVRVAEFIPGRTNDQCRERWADQLNTSSSKNTWNDIEDQALLDAVKTMGNQWKAISGKIGNGKTGASCRIRHNKLKKMIAGPAPAESSGSTPVLSHAQEGIAVHDPADPGPARKGKERASDIEIEQHVSTDNSTPPLIGSSTSQAMSAGKGKKRAADTINIDAPTITKKRRTRKPPQRPDNITVNEGTTDGASELAEVVPSASVQKPCPKPRPVAKRKGKGSGGDIQDATPNLEKSDASIQHLAGAAQDGTSIPDAGMTKDREMHQGQTLTVPMVEQTASKETTPLYETRAALAVEGPTSSRSRKPVAQLKKRQKKSAPFVTEAEGPMNESPSSTTIYPNPTKGQRKTTQTKRVATIGTRRSTRLAPNNTEPLNSEGVSQSSHVASSIPPGEPMDTQEDNVPERTTSGLSQSTQARQEHPHLPILHRFLG